MRFNVVAHGSPTRRPWASASCRLHGGERTSFFGLVMRNCSQKLG
jgi:hypothetical protein